MGGWRSDGDGGVMGEVNGGWWKGWGLMEGEGVLLGHRRLCARSSSVCMLVVCVRARRLCARSSSVCMLIILSVGIHYVWVARRRCLRGARLHPGWG